MDPDGRSFCYYDVNYAEKKQKCQLYMSFMHDKT